MSSLYIVVRIPWDNACNTHSTVSGQCSLNFVFHIKTWKPWSLRRMISSLRWSQLRWQISSVTPANSNWLERFQEYYAGSIFLKYCVDMDTWSLRKGLASNWVSWTKRLFFIMSTEFLIFKVDLRQKHMATAGNSGIWGRMWLLFLPYCNFPFVCAGLLKLIRDWNWICFLMLDFLGLRWMMTSHAMLAQEPGGSNEFCSTHRSWADSLVSEGVKAACGWWNLAFWDSPVVLSGVTLHWNP